MTKVGSPDFRHSASTLQAVNMPKRRGKKVKPAAVRPPSPPVPASTDPDSGPDAAVLLVAVQAYPVPPPVQADPVPPPVQADPVPPPVQADPVPPPVQADPVPPSVQADIGVSSDDGVSISPVLGGGSKDSSASPQSSKSSSHIKKIKKRGKKNDCSLNFEEEDQMLDFIRDNPILWNMKLSEYRRKDKKENLWQQQAELMDRTSENLQGWFRSLRDTNTRLDKKKSGDPGVQLTEREDWIYTKFAFLKGVTRHRSEPVQSVKATIRQHRGDLEAAETACAQMEMGRDEAAAILSTSPTDRKRPKEVESDLIQSLQKRVEESGSILKDITKAQQQPMTARTAFANYVRDSLMTMSKTSYKKARSSINRLLSELMKDSDDDDDLLAGTVTAPRPGRVQTQQQHPLRSSYAPSFGSYDQYQGHMLGTQPVWGHGQFYQYQHIPPPASVQQHSSQQQPRQSSRAPTPQPSTSQSSPGIFDQSLGGLGFGAMFASPPDLGDNDFNTPPSQSTS